MNLPLIITAAILSTLAGAASSRIASAWVAFGIALVSPVVLCYLVYWVSAIGLSGAQQYEYVGWQFAGVVLLSMIGVPCSLIALLVFRAPRRQRDGADKVQD